MNNRNDTLWSRICEVVSLQWNRYDCFVNFLIAICGAITAVFSCYAAINANEISKRAFANEEQSAQPIVTSFIKNDTLNILIEKEYRGLNFIDARPMVTMTEGIVNDQSLISMKVASFMFQGAKKYTTCATEDETNVIKCYEPELGTFLKKINEKKRRVDADTSQFMFRNLHMAYLLSVSYNDIYNNRQRQRFVVSHRGHQRSITDSLYNERFIKLEHLTKSDTTEESVKKILNKLDHAENMMKLRRDDF